jgi:AcrR family transcriptional regulator
VAGLVRPYRGVSAQQRKAERRSLLIEAALDVIGTEGLSGLTMTAVCSRAGLTERYFYESFRDRAELLGATFDACLQELDEAMFRALDGAPPDLLERCRAAAGAMIAVLTDDPRKARVHAEAVGSEAVRDRRSRAVATHAAILAEQMRALRGLDDPRYDAPLTLGTQVLIGGVADAILGWLDGTIDMPRETLIEECARLCVAVADAVAATSLPSA